MKTKLTEVFLIKETTPFSAPQGSAGASPKQPAAAAGGHPPNKAVDRQTKELMDALDDLLLKHGVHVQDDVIGEIEKLVKQHMSNAVFAG